MGSSHQKVHSVVHDICFTVIMCMPDTASKINIESTLSNFSDFTYTYHSHLGDPNAFLRRYLSGKQNSTASRELKCVKMISVLVMVKINRESDIQNYDKIHHAKLAL